MRRAVNSSRHQLRLRLVEKARHEGLPAHAPVALAEEVARDAMRRGAGLEDAFDVAWTYLTCWLRHPANSAAAPGLEIEPTIRLTAP